jgi:hypothetical protein
MPRTDDVRGQQEDTRVASSEILCKGWRMFRGQQEATRIASSSIPGEENMVSDYHYLVVNGGVVCVRMCIRTVREGESIRYICVTYSRKHIHSTVCTRI